MSAIATTTIESTVDSTMSPLIHTVEKTTKATTPFWNIFAIALLVSLLSTLIFILCCRYGLKFARTYRQKKSIKKCEPSKMNPLSVACLPYSTSEECAICLLPLKDEDVTPAMNGLLVLPCGHALHFNCVISWLERTLQCPVCRCDLPRSNRNPLQHCLHQIVTPSEQTSSKDTSMVLPDVYGYTRHSKDRDPDILSAERLTHNMHRHPLPLIQQRSTASSYSTVVRHSLDNNDDVHVSAISQNTRANRSNARTNQPMGLCSFQHNQPMSPTSISLQKELEQRRLSAALSEQRQRILQKISERNATVT